MDRLPSKNPNPPWLEPSSPGSALETELRQELRLFAVATRVMENCFGPEQYAPDEYRPATGLPDGTPPAPAYSSWVSEWVNRPMAALEAYRQGKLSRTQITAIRGAVRTYYGGDILTLDPEKPPVLPSQIPDPPKGVYKSPNFGGDAELARMYRMKLEKPGKRLVPKR